MAFKGVVSEAKVTFIVTGITFSVADISVFVAKIAFVVVEIIVKEDDFDHFFKFTYISSSWQQVLTQRGRQAKPC